MGRQHITHIKGLGSRKKGLLHHDFHRFFATLTVGTCNEPIRRGLAMVGSYSVASLARFSHTGLDVSHLHQTRIGSQASLTVLCGAPWESQAPSLQKIIGTPCVPNQEGWLFSLFCEGERQLGSGSSRGQTD